jgi:hypothetical protein
MRSSSTCPQDQRSGGATDQTVPLVRFRAREELDALEEPDIE